MTQDASDEAPAGAVDAHALLFSVITKIHMLHHLTATGFNRSQGNGLHISHFGVLNCLMRTGDGKTPQALANQMNLTKATMTNSLARLSENGLVKVQDNPNDKRSKLVFLTPAGRKERDAAVQRTVPSLEQSLARLDIKDLKELFRLLQVLHEAMDETEAARP